MDIFPLAMNYTNYVSPLVISTSAGADSVSTPLSNGTYDYYAAVNVSGYYSTSEFGSFTVHGSSVILPTIIFITGAYSVSFEETGLPSGMAFSVSFNGMVNWGSPVVFSVLPGTYQYSVFVPPGFTTSSSSRTVSVSGSTPVSIVFIPKRTYAVTFVETGLAPGTEWFIDVDGLYNSSTTSTISFSGLTYGFLNGTYSYTVGLSPGYIASPSAGTFTVNGAQVIKYITFTDAVYNAVFTPRAYTHGPPITSR
ncbi:hypothetical protein [Thermogymnomonas acidicola]|uniref:hypothetical protein n=1 Tax=Thermogymnomonas acidicola TaxID=399579 RepID=UPI0016658986|nr:hypothetical protein [Thermogymnomonas acidicola]